MTLHDPGLPAPQRVVAGETTLSVMIAGPAHGTPIVLVHGWPEIAYSWKHQIGMLADAGYRVIAPDLKGFGGSDAPDDPSLYDIRHMTDDLAHLLDALAIDRAIFCGHDWGGAIVWPMAQLNADRVLGVIGVSTPHRAPPPVEPLTILEKRFGPDHYIVRFQARGRPEALFAQDIDKFFRLMFRSPAPRARWAALVPSIYDLMGRFERGPDPDPASSILSDEERAIFVAAYQQSGFHGGIHLYRNIDRNYHIMKDCDPIIRTPSLWIGAELDMFLPPDGADDMAGLIPDLEKHVLADCGHWVMWEQPQRLNTLMLDWLSRRFAHS